MNIKRIMGHNNSTRVRNGRVKSIIRSIELYLGFIIFGQRLISGLVLCWRKGLLLAGEKNFICFVRLYCSTKILQCGQKRCIRFELRLSRVPQVWFFRAYSLPWSIRQSLGLLIELLEVCCSRKIAAGFQGILDSRAKVYIGPVMLAGSRKIVCRYAGICISCSVDHCGLFLIYMDQLSRFVVVNRKLLKLPISCVHVMAFWP